MNEKNNITKSSVIKKKPMVPASNGGQDADVYKNVLGALHTVLNNNDSLSPKMRSDIEKAITANMGALTSVVGEFTEKAMNGDGNLSQNDMAEFMKKMGPIVTNTISSVMPKTEASGSTNV